MGKLKGRGLPSRLNAAPERLRSHDHSDTGAEAGHRSRNWYNTPRWKRLRMKIALRDRWICQQTGVPLVGGKKKPNSLVTDHKVPHRGDPLLFWDEKNLQSVSKIWHDTVKQGMEKRGEI